MDAKHGEKAIERASSIAEQIGKAAGTDNFRVRAIDSPNAGEATRETAKRALEVRAIKMRCRANELITEARDGMKQMHDKTVMASELMNSATAIEALAAEADHLRGPAEFALWSLAVERAHNGV